MRISSLRILGLSLIAGALMGIAGGLVFALVGGRVIAHGIGTGLFVVGLLAFGLGVLGATEPPQGWSARRSGRSVPEQGRRSFGARLAGDLQAEPVTSLDLLVWGVVVGGGLIAASMVAFTVAV